MTIPTIEERRARWIKRGLDRYAETLRQSRLSGHLRVVWLRNARGARLAMSTDGHPGRDWWKRQWLDVMAKHKALR